MNCRIYRFGVALSDQRKNHGSACKPVFVPAGLRFRARQPALVSVASIVRRSVAVGNCAFQRTPATVHLRRLLLALAQRNLAGNPMDFFPQFDLRRRVAPCRAALLAVSTCGSVRWTWTGLSQRDDRHRINHLPGGSGDLLPAGLVVPVAQAPDQTGSRGLRIVTRKRTRLVQEQGPTRLTGTQSRPAGVENNSGCRASNERCSSASSGPGMPDSNPFALSCRAERSLT